MKLKVLSLFDGIAGARQALKNLNIDCEYYASEIDQYAIEVVKANHPDIIHIGDVKGIQLEDGWFFYNQNNDPMKNGGSFRADIDLLIGGSPCQDLSIAGKGEGLKGERSGLFFEYLRILNEVKPKYFVLENVASMKNADRDKISELLGVQPILINSAKLTAQQRKRYYWTNIPNVDQPEDKGIILKDVIEGGFVDKDKAYCIDANYHKGGNRKSYFEKARRQLIFDKPIRISQINKDCQSGRIYSVEGKSVCLNSGGGGGGAKTGLYEFKDGVRKLTVTECERLQGFPDNYCSNISNSQAYKALGNSFTVPVIEHIIKNLK